jgi:hypothetical protein
VCFVCVCVSVCVCVCVCARARAPRVHVHACVRAQASTWLDLAVMFDSVAQRRVCATGSLPAPALHPKKPGVLLTPPPLRRATPPRPPQRRKDGVELPTDRLEPAWGEWPPRAGGEPAERQEGPRPAGAGEAATAAAAAARRPARPAGVWAAAARAVGWALGPRAARPLVAVA